MKKVIILGSTGSIGKNALDVIRKNPDKISVAGLSAKKNIELLQRQIEEFRPSCVCVWDEEEAYELRKKIGNSPDVYTGMEGLLKLVNEDADMVLSALVGGVGLKPILSAIKSGKDIALANKEALVMAGEILRSEAKKNRVNIIPVDSEHSALMQCLCGREADEINRLFLTASGGPFYNKKDMDMDKVTPESALMHPTWKMGKKITVDSATLMNKGFEVIEASFLFDIPVEKIEVIIHPESLVHGMAEFIDGSVSAFMHIADMRIPIQYALSYPDRWQADYGGLDLIKVGRLHFEKPDTKRFPALELAYTAGRRGGTMPAVLSAADEICVERFLSGQIGFSDIAEIIKNVMDEHKTVQNPTIDDILTADKWTRNVTNQARLTSGH